MKLLAHRGIWEREEEKNSLNSLKKAIEIGIGVETDVRDLNGEIVISHDLPNSKSLKLKKFLDSVKNQKSFREVTYAWNIKSDGLNKNLKEILQDYRILKNSFFFDMSFPTLYLFSKTFSKENLATRASEFEKFPLMFYENCEWIWVDSFEGQWITEKEINSLFNDHKKVVFVSPELHKRDPKSFWKFLKKFKNKEFYLCTDLTKEAKEFFK